METVMQVRIVVSCASSFGALEEGTTPTLPPDIAESLMRAGYAEPLDVSADTKKNDDAPRSKKSKRATES